MQHTHPRPLPENQLTDTPQNPGLDTSELFCLITTLLDPGSAAARELAELYTVHWTSETVFKHIKTEQRGGRTATLRSNTPPWSSRNAWAMLCLYQALHQLAAESTHHAQGP